MTSQRTGMPPIPAELLAKMTPEQKAMLEARLKAKDSLAPQTTVRKQCITKEDLGKLMNFGDEHGACQRTVVSASSSKQEFRIECTSSGIKASGTVRVEALDSEHMKFSSQIAAGAMNVSTTGTGKWVSAECSSDSKK
jgi:hypothetical protein